MRLTYFGANSWLIQLGQQRILIDPWLVGSLVFGNLTWLFKGQRRQPLDSIPDKIDLIVLSQGLEDHAHRPTLEQLDRTIPAVASPSAAKVVKQLGYTHALQLAQWLQPQVFLPTAAGGDVEYEGFLASVLRTKGSVDELRSQLAQNNLPTQVIDPQRGESVELTLLRRVL